MSAISTVLIPSDLHPHGICGTKSASQKVQWEADEERRDGVMDSARRSCKHVPVRRIQHIREGHIDDLKYSVPRAVATIPSKIKEKKLITTSTVEACFEVVGRLPSLGTGAPSAMTPERKAASASSSVSRSSRALISLRLSRCPSGYDRPHTGTIFRSP